MLGFNPIAGAPVAATGAGTSAGAGATGSGISVGTAGAQLYLGATGLGSSLGHALGVNSAVVSAHGLGESFGLAFALYPEYTAWEAEVKLFDYSGPPILELDAAFEQAGRIVVAAERKVQNNSEIWIYWFNPTLGFFTFEKLGLGRNPRALLDDPFDTTNSDVLIFYVRLSDQRICYRQQRDRYLIEYQTPVAAEPHSYVDVYLQDIVKDRSGRLVVVYALHDVASGTWSYHRLESALYPLHIDADEFTAIAPSFQSGLFRPAVLNVGVAGPEGYITWEQFTAIPTQFMSGMVQKPLIDVGPPGSIDGGGAPDPYYNDVEKMTAVATQFMSGAVTQVVFDNSLFDLDKYTGTVSYQNTSTLVKIVIDVVLFDLDKTTAALTFIAAGSSLA